MNMMEEKMSEQKLDVFSKYLSVWVAAAMVLGALLGNILPGLD
jgi:ACR3 family arsenite transporter